MDKSVTALGHRSVLQRHSNISNTVQAGLDGLAIIAVTCGLVELHIGYITSPYLIMLLLLIGVLAIVYDRLGIYRSNGHFPRKALSLFKAWTASFAILTVIGFLTKQTAYYSRLLVGELYVIGLFVQMVLHFTVRRRLEWIAKQTHQRENALIIGTGGLAHYLYRKISSNPWLGQRVLGCVSLDNTAADIPNTEAKSHPEILGSIDDLAKLIDDKGVRTVYVVTSLNAAELLNKIYFGLIEKHVAIHWIPDIFSLRLVNHSVREISGVPVLTLSESPLIGTRKLLKSVEDMVLAAAILLLISPLLAVIALAVKLDSPGPVFFKQKRMGWNGQTFEIWKFRSMVVHQPENNIIKQAEKNDPRITKVGAFLRKTSLDELPQLFNVLRGEMSLVGPRPHAIQHDEEYSRRISDYFARHNIKPGITGLAQVRGHRGETKTVEQMIQRVQSDIEYINNWSIWLDFMILMRTSLAFTGKNAY